MARSRSRPIGPRSANRTWRPRLECLEGRAVPSVSAGPGGSDREVAVMTRNLYVGADFGPVVTAPNLLAASDAAGIAFAQVQATNFPERAVALAAEIAERQPTLVGLQEVSKFLSGPVLDPTPATTVEYDFLASLRAELAARGLRYRVVAEVQVFDAELPTRVGGVFVRDIRLIDREVILARDDLPTSQLKLSNARTGYFAAHLAVTVGGAGGPVISFGRGWASVDAEVRGKTFRFISTHLEPESPVPAINAIQVAQGNELLAGPANTTLPVVLVGDFNSQADGGGTVTYGNLTAAAFVDAWAVTQPGDSGNTIGHAPDLRNATVDLTERIDLVLFRGDLVARGSDRVGEELADRTASGLWPSDHVGVAAVLVLHDRPGHGGRAAPPAEDFANVDLSAVARRVVILPPPSAALTDNAVARRPRPDADGTDTAVRANAIEYVPLFDE